MGRGQADALSGDGKAISDLLVAPVPSLQSQLLPKSAFSSNMPSSPASSTQPCPTGQLQGIQQPAAAWQMLAQLAAGAELTQVALHGLHSGTQTQSAFDNQSAVAHSHPSQMPIGAQAQWGITQKGTAHGPLGLHGGPAMVLPLQRMLDQTQTQPGATQQGTAHGPPGLSEDAAATVPLRRMLLEGVANKSIQSLQDINRLASSTLLAHQAQSSRVQSAIRSALVVLR